MQSQAMIKAPMVDEKGRAYGTGRRKEATARVWVKRGDGDIVVNGMSFVEYFPRVSHRVHFLEPLREAMALGAFDVWLTVKGGGVTGVLLPAVVFARVPCWIIGRFLSTWFVVFSLVIACSLCGALSLLLLV